jgi:predicted nucleic acid-binding protein
VDVSDGLVKLAGGLAEVHALRGADAIHLASALALRKQIEEDVKFFCFDDRLTVAARKEGLKGA